VAREIIKQEKVFDYTVRPSLFEEFSKKFGVAVGKGVGLALDTALNSTVQLR
jgi:hypothetical protein